MKEPLRVISVDKGLRLVLLQSFLTKGFVQKTLEKYIF